MGDTGHWDTTLVGDFDPAEFFGFVYEIEELSTGRAYIGKKFFRFKRQKTKSNPSRTKESDWREYTSSCEPLSEAIQKQGKQDFAFRILSLCVGRCQLTYEEQQVQFTRDVLRTRLPNGERKYWNRTIGHLLFAGVEKQTEESKSKMRAALTGRSRPPFSEETRQKMSAAHMGKTHTTEERQKIADSLKGNQHRLGIPHTDETRRRISETKKLRP
jgi:hypothetical protein